MNSKEKSTYKLKIQLPNGMSLEAEGDRDFIETEKKEFLSMANKNTGISLGEKRKTTDKNLLRNENFQRENSELIWERLGEIKNGYPVLYQKTKSAQESAALILAMHKILLNKEETPALRLSKSLKKSGHIIERLDRTLSRFIEDKFIISKGTKRNRRYYLSDKGLAKAFVIAENHIQE